MNQLQLEELLSGKFGKAQSNIVLKEFTTLNIGGPADVLIEPSEEEQIINLVQYCKENKIELTVIGKGSNIIIRDKGIRGVVLLLSKEFDEILVKGNEITAQSGAALRDVSIKSFGNSLTGMEAVSGIPGSIGGAIIMNAGAYGTEMKDIVKSVRLLDSEGNVHEYSNEEMDFSYRSSIASKEGQIVLSTTFSLKEGDKEEIYSSFEDFDYKRSSKQPLDSFSAGSTFKRPEGHFASKLIDDSGLRGFTVGDAMVSEKHCGFLINKNNSTCENYLKLISEVQRIVYEKYNIKLEREVKLIGEE